METMIKFILINQQTENLFKFPEWNITQIIIE